MGLYITLRDAAGAVVRQMPDPLGGTFDASGDFDELLGRGASPMLDTIDPYGNGSLAADDMPALAAEVDDLLATVPESERVAGRKGAAWHGLNRFRVMVRICEGNPGFTLNFLGD